MFCKYVKSIFCFLLLFYLTIGTSHSEKIKNIIVSGNDRISIDTIIMFGDYSLNSSINSEDDINKILKNIYDSNFFKNVSVNFLENILTINVEELPIIETIYFEGIKAKKIRDKVFTNLFLKQRSSYNEIFLKQDKIKIQNNLKSLGYYSSIVDITLNDLGNNKVDLKYLVKLGSKARIQKISFIGNKIFKDRKLKSVITSEEYKFWKFISGKKYLNQNLIKFDEKLIKNFYLNQGYHNVKISSSFAKLIKNDSFELIFNIDAKEKYYFNDLILNLPNDFEINNFNNLNNLFKDLKNERYSINKIEDILEEIDKVTLEEQFESITANVEEIINNNKINLNFNVIKTDRLNIERINILGNNITRENVIRNQFEIDEGDPYNDILIKKTINNLKNLGFFKVYIRL